MKGGVSSRLHGEVYRLINVGVGGTLSDAELLDRFVTGRGEAAEAAFAELVHRHAPMVLQVCRDVLRNSHDAEDAFQAVFLILASRAGSIRRPASIASWLFGVARRVASRSRRGAARRRTLDRRVAERTSECYLTVESDRDREIIHEEIACLPERLRTPVVLCYLQGLTYAAAARQLGLSEVAIRGRLARARERLRQRLSRRGITAPTSLFVAGAAGHARVSVPATLIHSTIRIAFGFIAGNTVATLARGVLISMLLFRLRIALAVIGLGLGGSYSAWQTFAAAGDEKGHGPGGQTAAAVQSIHPPVRKIVREIGQPSFIEAYETTPVFPKRQGYIEKPIADIGDKVKKGDVLATLRAPERADDIEAQRAIVQRDELRLETAKKMVKLADANLQKARASLAEARAIIIKFQAMVDRWDTEVKRLDREVKRGVVDPQVLRESENQRKSSVAARDAAQATIATCDAEVVACEAALAKAKVDVRVAEAELGTSHSKLKRLVEQTGRFAPRAHKSDGLGEAEVDAARMRLAVARAIQSESETDVRRWDAELKRLRHMVDSNVLTKPIDKPKAKADARDVAGAAIEKAEAEVISYRAALSKAKVDASVASATLAVAQCLTELGQLGPNDFAVTAPCDGVIIARNAQTFDFVEPSTGQNPAAQRRPDDPVKGATPLFVVARVDMVRVSANSGRLGIDIPERDARYVHAGTRASVVVKAYRDEPIEARVARTSWGLNVKGRVLRAEIDLQNSDGRLKPGMYAYCKVIIERPDARVLPAAAVTSIDNKDFCWTYQNGRAVRTEIETGPSDGQWIEVIHWRTAGAKSAGGGSWAPLDGSEQIIVGDLSALRDNAPVQVAPTSKEPR